MHECIVITSESCVSRRPWQFLSGSILLQSNNSSELNKAVLFTPSFLHYPIQSVRLNLGRQRPGEGGKPQQQTAFTAEEYKLRERGFS